MKKDIKKWTYFSLATVFLALAYLGIVLPGFPGTPFILLTAFFYVRSSEKMYNWLMRQKIFNKLIKEFENDVPIALRIKVMVLIPFWISILVAELFFVEQVWAHIVVLTVAIIFTVFLLRLKNVKISG
ncbi:MAG: YbaN family protein [Bacteroidales bacterium]|nr:YbaN family protein [Bacteroidales bacterium]